MYPPNRPLGAVVAFVLVCLGTLPARAGSIFITGHDPIWHSNFGGNVAGATKLAQVGIAFARNGSTEKFLFVESKTTPIPGGNARTAPFLTSRLGFSSSDFDVMDAADLMALADFRAALDGYSAIVVASDHGGMLSAAELSFLNNHSGDVIDYLNAGGGLFAEGESNATGMIGSTPRFKFLPFLVASSDFNAFESGNTVTAFGASLGLTASDVNGNFSHNYFSATGGMTPVDFFNGDPNRPLTLASRSQVSSGGVVPLPGVACAGLVLLGGTALRRRRAITP